MEANTYLIHQGGGNKDSTGSTERWGWARLPCGDRPRGKANERVGSGCSPHREVGGHEVPRGRGGGPWQFDKPTFPAPGRPLPARPRRSPGLTCPHRVGEVVAKGGGAARELLQLPAAQVEPPGVSRLLQRPLQTAVQRRLQTQSPAATAAAAAHPGRCRQSSRGEGLRLACQRRHLSLAAGGTREGRRTCLSPLSLPPSSSSSSRSRRRRGQGAEARGSGEARPLRMLRPSRHRSPPRRHLAAARCSGRWKCQWEGGEGAALHCFLATAFLVQPAREACPPPAWAPSASTRRSCPAAGPRGLMGGGGRRGGVSLQVCRQQRVRARLSSLGS